MFIKPCSRYRVNKKLFCDDQKGKQTNSSPPNFLSDHYSIKVIFPLYNISEYIDYSIQDIGFFGERCNNNFNPMGGTRHLITPYKP